MNAPLVPPGLETGIQANEPSDPALRNTLMIAAGHLVRAIKVVGGQVSEEAVGDMLRSLVARTGVKAPSNYQG